MGKIRGVLSGIACLLVLYAGLVGPAQAKNKVTLILTNAQGTVVATADSQGNVTYTAAYRPYGKQQVGMPQPGPGYTGHVNDPDTGLVYMQARYYEPSGRFLSLDPVTPTPGNIFSFNRYTYANNNPIINADPTGMASDDDCGGPACKFMRKIADKATSLYNETMGHSLSSASASQSSPLGAIQYTNDAFTASAASEAAQVAGSAAPYVDMAPGASAGACAINGGCGGVDWAIAVVGVWPEGGAAERSSVRLFRAVGMAEHADILATGILRAGPNSFETGKWFAESAKDAVRWGNVMEGKGNFRILQLNFPSSVADKFFRIKSLDGIGPARFGTFDQIGKPTISTLPILP